jgi:hypothetical protein
MGAGDCSAQAQTLRTPEMMSFFILETVTSSRRPLLPSKSLLNYCDALSGIKENSVAGRDHRTKAHFAVGDALVSFGDLVERVGLGHYFDFSRCGDL